VSDADSIRSTLVAFSHSRSIRILYLPIGVLILFSSTAKAWAEFRRTIQLSTVPALSPTADLGSVVNSLQVALAAMVISLTFGVPAALALERAQFQEKRCSGGWCCTLILPGNYYWDSICSCCQT